MNRPQVAYFLSGPLVYFPSGARTEEPSARKLPRPRHGRIDVLMSITFSRVLHLRDAKTRQDSTIAYGDVEKVDKARPEWAKLLIFVGAMYGAGAILFLIALSGGH
jgi:hypothetical protein